MSYRIVSYRGWLPCVCMRSALTPIASCRSAVATRCRNVDDRATVLETALRSGSGVFLEEVLASEGGSLPVRWVRRVTQISLRSRALHRWKRRGLHLTRKIRRDFELSFSGGGFWHRVWLLDLCRSSETASGYGYVVGPLAGWLVGWLMSRALLWKYTKMAKHLNDGFCIVGISPCLIHDVHTEIYLIRLLWYPPWKFGSKTSKQ